jgi:hypothetical protein
MDNIFLGSTLYRTSDEMHACIIEHWMYAGGANSRDTVAEFLADMTDEQFVNEIMENWFSENCEDGCGDDYDGRDERVSREDLLSAMKDFRLNFESEE